MRCLDPHFLNHHLVLVLQILQFKKALRRIAVLCVPFCVGYVQVHVGFFQLSYQSVATIGGSFRHDGLWVRPSLLAKGERRFLVLLHLLRMDVQHLKLQLERVCLVALNKCVAHLFDEHGLHLLIYLLIKSEFFCNLLVLGPQTFHLLIVNVLETFDSSTVHLFVFLTLNLQFTLVLQPHPI